MSLHSNNHTQRLNRVIGLPIAAALLRNRVLHAGQRLSSLEADQTEGHTPYPQVEGETKCLVAW